MQQGGQGAAVCVVLQQVFHQGERWGAPLLSMLPPVASLKPWQWHKYITYTVCAIEGDTYSRLDSLTPTHRQIGVNLRTFKLSGASGSTQIIQIKFIVQIARQQLGL